jgi:plasmid stability protein
MVRTQIQLPEEQHRWLKAEAYRRGVSVAAVVRELVAEKLPDTESQRRGRAQAAWEAFIGCFSDPATDVSENHDRYLAEIYDEGNG